MCSGGGKTPKPAPRAPEAPRAPDVATSRSNNDDQRRRAANGTVFTSARGVQAAANTQTKVLLGQ